MPVITISISKCVAYFLRALMLLALLAEAYTFLTPSSYSAYWTELNEDYFSTALVLLEEMLRSFLKATMFCMSVHYTLLVFDTTWGVTEINNTRDWGMVVYVLRPTRAFAFRCAISRHCWMTRFLICSLGVLVKVVEFVEWVENGVVAGVEDT